MLTYPSFEPVFERQDWTLPRVLEHRAEGFPDRPFLQMGHDGDCYSFSRANRVVNSVAHGLARLGLKQHDRIVLMLPNSLELIFTWFAANKLGAVEVPINTAYKGDFLEHQVNISDAKIAVISDEYIDRWLESIGRLSKIETVIVWSKNGRPQALLPRIGRCRVIAYEDIPAENESNPGVNVRPQDLAAILFTSGTTGLSKGVMMPHAQLYFFAEQAVQFVKLTRDDVTTSALPLFHGNAQFLTIYPTLIVGAHCVLYERFSASQWIDQLHASQATVTNTIGVMWPFLTNQPPTDRDRSHRLRRVLATPTPHDADSIKERFGIEVFSEGFGQTEICVPIMAPYGVPRPTGSCGVKVDQWFDIRLVRPETDEEVPVGEVGELIVRHKEPWTLNAGYAGMPDKTLEAYRNLWFHTGDALRQDENGWYYFVDRIKDALRRRGENISSFELEAPIRRHPAVADVAIIGVPSEFAGGEDEVKACVVLAEGQKLTPESVIDWCVDRMPDFAVPRYVEFMEMIPRTPSEKVQKNKLRENGINAATWDRNKAGYRIKSR